MSKVDEKYFEAWKNNLQSSVVEVGDYVTQIIHFIPKCLATLVRIVPVVE